MYSSRAFIWMRCHLLFFSDRLGSGIFLFLVWNSPLVVKRQPCILSPGQTDSQVDASFGLAFNLRFVWLPTCIDLRGLWSSSNLDASVLPFGHPAQVDTSWSQVIYRYKNALTNYMREIYGFLRFASWLANPFGHPSQVRTQVCRNVW